MLCVLLFGLKDRKKKVDGARISNLFLIEYIKAIVDFNPSIK